MLIRNKFSMKFTTVALTVEYTVSNHKVKGLIPRNAWTNTMNVICVKSGPFVSLRNNRT